MKRSLLIHIYIAIFFFCLPSANAQVTQQQKTAATDSLLRVKPTWLALQEERFIPYSDTLPYGTRTIHVALTPSSITACSTSTPLTSSSVLPWEKRIIDFGVTDYEHFAAEYNYLGRDVWQQTLNLTEEEKERLIALLTENYRPENRVYRYNFFYDNCATRPRDQIERAINGTLQYPDNMTANSTGISFSGFAA